MSTSPSWFDQEKFSRLVKKVGPKTVTEPLPSPHGLDPENRSLTGEGLAPTSRISLVSKPPSLLAERRSLPALPRRTAPLPTLKTLFPKQTPPDEAPSPGEPSVETQTGSDAPKEETSSPDIESAQPLEADDDFTQDSEGLAAAWQKMSLLNEELARTIHERDQAVSEGLHLREQLRRADEAMDAGREASGTSEALARATKERDDAVAEAQAIRARMLQAQEPAKDTGKPSKTQALSLASDERDQARREYANLRTQFETFKQEQTPKEDIGKIRREFEQQLEELRQKLADRDREISGLKANASAASGGDGKLKDELASVREQLARAKDDVSVAQRGLALSQKALHETRDTLREATEGTSLSRHNFDNLKNECAILSQQNTVLQAQNDQLTRDLAATKSKLTTRL
jgi:chromosome segregation ATPase